MAVRYNFELQLPLGIPVRIDTDDYDEAMGKVSDWLNAVDELAAQHGITVEPDWQFGLDELG
jgi:hypothetical protein